MGSNKTYRTEEFNLHEVLNQLIEVLSGYRELELVKEVLRGIRDHQLELAKLERMPLEVKIKSMEIYTNLTEKFLEEGQVKKRAGLFGFGADPVETASEKALEATQKVLNITQGKLPEAAAEQNKQIAARLGNQLNGLLERGEINGGDKERLEDLKELLGQYAKGEDTHGQKDEYQPA